MKSRILYAVVIVGLVFGLAACQCGQPAVEPTAKPAEPTEEEGGASCAPNCTYADMTLCYPQLGAESDWRTANTASFKETAEELGFKLVFSDAQQKQENQISAIRACIQQKVDVIALPPLVEDGFEQVLTEAKNAGIPVIIVDRSVSA
ncbi:MAG: substrate-binding domain-containing protein, partial [Anaerolineae bacterium]|nr:substrate-binding domain-containing protein [Anaerolineae bacterium]